MATSGTYTYGFDVADIIEEAYERIGVHMRSGYELKTARRSLDLLLLEWQNRGLNLWKVKDTSQALTAGQSAYTLSAEKLDVIEAVLRVNAGDASNQTDTHMERISVSNYAQKSNKLQTGRPTEYWLERTPSAIILNVWPVPDSVTTYVLHYYYMEQIQESGKPVSNTVDVPLRHIPALTAGLAFQLAQKRPQEAGPLLQALKQQYEEQWNLAADSVREKANAYLVPGGY